MGVRAYDGVFFHHVRRAFNKHADALANFALDSGSYYHWKPATLKKLFELIADAQRPPIFIQGRFDGAFRRTTGKSAIGASLELVIQGSVQEVLCLLSVAREVSCIDSYEAEFEAAGVLIAECTQLYTKILLAATPTSGFG